MKRLSSVKGFTIVELLVVIVIIGILAAITIVSYTGITQKAIAASLQADLNNASQKLKIWQLTESLDGSYPETLRCDIPDTNIAPTNLCVKTSGSNTFGASYVPNNTANPKTFTLTATNGSMAYNITQDTAPTLATGSLAVTDPANWLTVGTQVWSKSNINVGTRIDGINNQTNNSILEKYCYDNNEANCTTYGGLYQWDEVMQYVTTEGARGICPAGSHIPTDGDWTILTAYLGGEISAGIQMQVGGSSGLNVSLAGYRDVNNIFLNLLSSDEFWSSSQSISDVWVRNVYAGIAPVDRGTYSKTAGFSLRCVEN